MNRLLCWLGIHEWRWFFGIDHKWCIRCGKVHFKLRRGGWENDRT